MPFRKAVSTLVAVEESDFEKCAAAIEGGRLDTGVPSRRRRRRILAVDRDGDLAAVLVATRGKRYGSSLSAELFGYERGEWVDYGNVTQSWEPEPRLRSRDSIPGDAIRVGSLGHASDLQLPQSVSAAIFQAGTDVATVEWRDVPRPVSPTGFGLVMWQGRPAPRVVGHDPAGGVVAEVSFSNQGPQFSRRAMADRIADLLPGGGADGWFNYRPPS